jgi:hypothetical protein
VDEFVESLLQDLAKDKTDGVRQLLVDLGEIALAPCLSALKIQDQDPHVLLQIAKVVASTGSAGVERLQDELKEFKGKEAWWVMPLWFVDLATLPPNVVERMYHLYAFVSLETRPLMLVALARFGDERSRTFVDRQRYDPGSDAAYRVCQQLLAGTVPLVKKIQDE